MSNRIFTFLLFLVAVAAMIWPALYNGYPLVYSDTGTYIYAGFENFTPIDRPFLYCFFVRHISLAATLWTVIIMQSIILCYLLWLVCRVYFQFSLRRAMLVILLLAVLSGSSNYTSQVMPDIFSLILILVFFLFYRWKELRKTERLSLVIIYFFTVGFHFSNVLMASMLIVVLFLVRLVEKKPLKKLAGTIPLWIIGTWCIIPLVNWQKTGSPFLSKTSNIFLSGRLIEMRILPAYLDESCATHTYPLCNAPGLDSLVSWQFLWEMSSPLYQGDCKGQKWDSCWLMQNDAYGKMLRDMFGHGKYAGQYLVTSSRDAVKQFANYNIGVLGPMRENSPVEPWIKAFYPTELTAYRNARQYQEPLFFKHENRVQQYAVWGAAAVLIFAFFYSWKNQKALFVLLVLMLCGLMANAFTCSALSTVIDRYQGRIIGVVVFLALAFLMRWASGKIKES